ncbi:sensor histidine kinase [Cohnella faecalis]|nr:HAMP domain-containing sensor histidine kinase [Cohnella faecalis]
MKEDLLRQLLLFVGLAVFALVLGLLTFRPVLRKTLIPLSNIVGTMERMDSERLNERLPEEHGQTEIDRLAHSFNLMLGRLEASFLAEQEAKEQMRRFVADASHELRTPLTSIHGFLEVLLRGAASNPEQLRKSLESMHGESERMNKLVRDLLTLARLDRAPTVQWTEADLSSIVEEMEPQLQLLADRRKVEFDLHFGSYRLLDIDKIKQVILNLFHNSIQHTDPERGKIRLLVRPVAQGIELSVADNGSGILPDHLPHLFERFYRIDSSRTRKSGGAGLGLSITKSIVDLHGGSITVDSRVGEGTVFRIRLPDNMTKVLSLS